MNRGDGCDTCTTHAKAILVPRTLGIPATAYCEYKSVHHTGVSYCIVAITLSHTLVAVLSLPIRSKIIVGCCIVGN